VLGQGESPCPNRTFIAECVKVGYMDFIAIGDTCSDVWFSSLEKQGRAPFFITKYAFIISDLEWRVAALPFQWVKYFVNRCYCNVVDVIGHRFLCDSQNDIQHGAMAVTREKKALIWASVAFPRSRTIWIVNVRSASSLVIGSGVSLRRASVISSETFIIFAMPVWAGTQ